MFWMYAWLAPWLQTFSRGSSVISLLCIGPKIVCHTCLLSRVEESQISTSISKIIHHSSLTTLIFKKRWCTDGTHHWADSIFSAALCCLQHLHIYICSCTSAHILCIQSCLAYFKLTWLNLYRFSSGSVFAWVELLGICKICRSTSTSAQCICTVHICCLQIHIGFHLWVKTQLTSWLINMSFNWSRLHAKANLHWKDGWVICEFTMGHLPHPSYYRIRHIHHTITDALFTTLSMLCIFTFRWFRWFSCQLIVSTVLGNSTLMDHCNAQYRRPVWIRHWCTGNT